jgi:hypothetical protein
MIRPKPLKDARWTINKDTDEFMFQEKDVASAVEWLKEEIYERRQVSHPISNNELYELIDKAFEDVVKGGRKG